MFKPLHPTNTLQENLSPSQCLGPVDPTTVPSKAPKKLTEDDKRVRAFREDMPPIDSCLNLYDIEKVGEGCLSKTAWAYYRSAANGGDSKSSHCATQALPFRLTHFGYPRPPSQPSVAETPLPLLPMPLLFMCMVSCSVPRKRIRLQQLLLPPPSPSFRDTHRSNYNDARDGGDLADLRRAGGHG
jgi:L-lactate dehydrogenase (cytochrome)